MSKEQIQTICDDAKVITDNDNKMIRCHINIKYFDWLIEQAERFEVLSEQHDEALMQNKRYREVITELRDFVKRGENECNIKQLIMKKTNGILEGEE